MPSEKTDRAPTEELLELPPTLENINAKMNHIIVRHEVGLKMSERAALASEQARDLAQQAKIAASSAATEALRASRLPTTLRLLTTFAGAAFGGSIATVVMKLTAVAALGTAISSCLR